MAAGFKKTEKPKHAPPKAAIGYSYEENQASLTPAIQTKDLDSDEGNDPDLDIKLTALSKSQVDELNGIAREFGIKKGKFSRLLRDDEAHKEAMEKGKQFNESQKRLRGRKAKRQRRFEREKRRVEIRGDSPMSFARRSSPSYDPYRSSSSSSRSSSPDRPERVEFITEFGGEGKAAVASSSAKSSSRRRDQKRDRKRHRRRISSSSSSSSSTTLSSSSSSPSRLVCTYDFCLQYSQTLIAACVSLDCIKWRMSRAVQ
eukprot:m.85189 g.85189  ORF g.85189 m.85189 type:complete len:258 (+) comp36433_c0_seq19:270-1043(+)